MNRFKGQLHIHSVLSPCASLEMGPRSIFKKAKDVGLDFIAITDHNSTKNLRAFKSLEQEFGIKLIYGIEVETNEEVHILCYFDDIDRAENLGEMIYNSLLPIPNDPEIFGEQVIVDFQENITGFEEKLLLQRSSYGIDKVNNLVAALSGLAIPAHVDRRKNGLLPTLGIIESEQQNNILEVSKTCDIRNLEKEYCLENQIVYKGCDAHYIDDIGVYPVVFEIAEISILEIKKAFCKEEKRNWYQL